MTAQKPEQKLNRRQLLSQGAVAAASLVATSQTAKSDLSLGSLPDLAARRSSSPSVFKQTAKTDYARNMQAFGGSLAADPRCLFGMPPNGKPWQFDVLIVGSGYGASITAARLSEKMQPGSRIAMLERGREQYQLQFARSSNSVPTPTTMAEQMMLLGLPVDAYRFIDVNKKLEPRNLVSQETS